MLSMDDPFEIGVSPSVAPCITVRIIRTEEQMSLMMQRFTAYVIQINDFGRVKEVTHRYGDFETLHKTVLTECPGAGLPNMPPKGLDGTDVAVVAARKVELEKVLRAMLSSPEVLMEKELSIWKFLDLGNPAVIVGRFIMVPRARANALKTMSKLNDVKYNDDVYRLGHQVVTDLLMEGLREQRRGNSESHWATQAGARTAICQLVAGALGTSDE
ncbi:unnamed protein product, partial [Polarella glacialis]